MTPADRYGVNAWAGATIKDSNATVIYVFIFYTIDCNRAMRFSVDGCVENTSPSNPRAPGSAMHANAIDFILSKLFVRDAPLILRNALASPIGFRVMCAP